MIDFAITDFRFHRKFTLGGLPTRLETSTVAGPVADEILGKAIAAAEHAAKMRAKGCSPTGQLLADCDNDLSDWGGAF